MAKNSAPSTNDAAPRQTKQQIMIDLLRRRARIEDDDTEQAVIDKITAAVQAQGDEATAELPFLRYLLGVDPG